MNSGPILTHQNILVNPAKFNLSKLSIGEYVLQQMRHYGSIPAMVHAFSGVSISFDDIFNESIKVAEGLKSKGVKEGDVVGICSENRLEYASAMLGILSTGATCITLSPIYNIEELAHILAISRPKLILCSPFVIAKMEECQSRFPFIKELIVFDSDYNSSPKVSSYDKLIQNSARFETFRFPDLDVDDAVAFLFCSSGTTGLPKCVELTHVNIMHLLNFMNVFWNKEPSRKVILGLIPFFHAYGTCTLLGSLIQKVLNVVMMRFDEEVFLRSIQKYRITHLFLVPPLVLFLASHPLVAKYDLSSVVRVTCGAAFLSKETQTAAQKRLNLTSGFRQAYGMTELSVACVAFQSDVDKVGSSGTVAPGMECKVVDLITGKALPPFERGELCFRGPFVMKGYRNNPEATAASFDNEGWFHTGDIAYFDNDGYLYIVDRLKELIKYKGFQVPPAELEALLINHPLIKEAGVIGIPDEEAGELPLAFVVVQPGAKITEKEIQHYVAGKVSPQKRLHGGVRFIKEIPKNPNGKILRRELRVLAKKSKL